MNGLSLVDVSRVAQEITWESEPDSIIGTKKRTGDRKKEKWWLRIQRGEYKEKTVVSFFAPHSPFFSGNNLCCSWAELKEFMLLLGGVTWDEDIIMGSKTLKIKSPHD